MSLKLDNQQDINDDRFSIPEYFADKVIFLTGGSGFIGKVLIEKFLRSCPNLRTIYLLMRPKKNKTIEERIKEITNLPLFDRLKNENMPALKKIKLIEGDITQLNLGLSEEDENLIVNEVNIIYHMAASVRFDEPLGEAIIKNTRSTRELCQLALKMKNLNVFIHVSTTYCNTDKDVIEEKLYPPHADWKTSIALAENVDPDVLDTFTLKYMEPLPNTYTFSKSLAEHVVYDLCNGKIPLVIFRPSIVISTLKEPFPGWIDNFNGPIGILITCGKGIIRSVFADPNIAADYVPVDIIVKALIISTWQKGITQNQNEKYEATFYNASKNDEHPITMGDIVEIGKVLCEEIPFNDIIWFPNSKVTKCRFLHYLKVIFYQLLPALLIDGILKLSGRKPILTKIQRKVYSANMALEYFITKEWTFVNKNAANLETILKKSDYNDFFYDRNNINVLDYFKKGSLGARRYLLNEDDSTLEQAKIHYKRMWIISWIFTILWYGTIFYIIFFKYDILTYLSRKYENICNYFLTE